MRGLGYIVALVGCLALWLGFAASAGWLSLREPLRWTAFAVCLGGLVTILWSGFLLNKPIARGFIVPGICLLLDAALIWLTVPGWVNAGSSEDAVNLVAIIGAGTSLFLGLALFIAAALAAAFSSGK